MSTEPLHPPLQVHRAGNFCQIYFDDQSSRWDPAIQLKVRQIMLQYGVYDRPKSYQGLELQERKKLWREGLLPGERPEFSTEKRQLYVACPDGTFQFTRGLLPSVWPALWAIAGGVEYVDHRQNVLPPAMWARLRTIPDFAFRIGQKEALAMIDTQDGGILDLPTGFGKSYLMTTLPVIYPQSRLCFLAPGSQLIESLYQRLNKMVPGQVGRIGGGYSEPDARIILGSVDSIHKVPMEKQHLVVCDEVHSMGTDKRLGGLMTRFSEAKFFGLTASHGQRFDKGDREIEAVFGPVIYSLSYQQVVDTGGVSPIEVHVFDVPEGPSGDPIGDANKFIQLFPEFAHIPYTDAHKLTTNMPSVIKKRNAYWRNSFRNAYLARAVSSMPDIVGKDVPQTLLMCETVEHLFRLREFLPSASLVYKDAEDVRPMLESEGLWRSDNELNAETIQQLVAEGRWDRENFKNNIGTIKELRREQLWVEGDWMTDARRSHLRREFEAGDLKLVIANMVWKQGIDPVYLDVFVRAEGTTSGINSIQLPGRLSRIDTKKGKDRGFLVALNDRWDEWASRRAKECLSAYKKAGFKIVHHGPEALGAGLFTNKEA